jgi:hypothetical protein
MVHIYSNTASVFKKAGPAYPSRAREPALEGLTVVKWRVSERDCNITMFYSLLERNDGNLRNVAYISNTASAL